LQEGKVSKGSQPLHSPKHTFHFKSRTARQKFLIQNSYHVLPNCRTGTVSFFLYINLSRFGAAS